MTRLEDTLNESVEKLGVFAKSGFLGSILVGSKPKQQFEQLDSDLTMCINELSVTLQTTQLNEQVQTYKVVCDIHGGI